MYRKGDWSRGEGIENLESLRPHEITIVTGREPWGFVDRKRTLNAGGREERWIYEWNSERGKF